MAALIPLATLILVSLAGLAFFMLLPPESGRTGPLMTAAVLGGSIASSFLLLASLWPDRFLRLLYRVKVLGDVSLRFNLPENLRLGSTLLAPLNLMIILWCSGLILLRRHLLRPYVPVLIFLLPFFAWQIVVLGIYPSQQGLVRFLSQLWVPLIFMVTLVSSMKIRDLQGILTTTQILAAIMLLTVVSEWLVGWPAPIQQMDADIAWEQGRTVRFGGIWGIRSKAAESWAEMSYLVSLCTLLVRRRQGSLFFHTANIAFCLFVISLTGSKTPIFVLGSASVIAIALSVRATRGVIVISIVAVGAFSLISSGLFDRTFERMQTEQSRFQDNTTLDAMGTGRYGIWSAAIQNWRQAGPATVLLGGGLFSSEDFVNAGDRLGTEKDFGLHSQHLAVLIELGIVGLALYFLFWIGLVRLMILPTGADEDLTYARLIAAGLLVGILVRGIAGDVLNGVYYTWYLAIPLALLAKARLEPQEPHDPL